jgi:hypothetical protein
MKKPEDIAKVADAAQLAEASPVVGDPEQRRAARRRALKSGLIAFDGGRCSMTCHILDMSENGARIMPADVVMCPDQFVLKPLSGPERACEVVWRKGMRIGVRFF